MRISFYIADKAVGATGFRAVWTEVKRKETCRENEFKCKGTRFCISRKLKCNKVNNCGRVSTGDLDKSDELECEIRKLLLIFFYSIQFVYFSYKA